MNKIDRLGWAAGMSFNSYGVRVGIRVNDPAALNVLKPHFPPGWKESSSRVVDRLYSFILGGFGQRHGVRRYNLLYGDIMRLVRAVNLDEVLATFESDLHLYVALQARTRVFVHAGVVGWKGRAILFPGRTYSGKSTLVAELVRAGATYFSDEYALLDQRGLVYPFSRELQIRKPGGLEQEKWSAKELGGHTGNAPLTVGAVIITKYRPQARWRPKVISVGRGLVEMLANTVSARSWPERALVAVEKVAKRALILKGTRGEAKDVVGPLLEHLEKG